MAEMNKKRLLTLDDLYEYYSTHSRSSHFSSKESGADLVVHIPSNITFCATDNIKSGQSVFDDTDKSKEGLLPVVLQTCHIGINNKNTSIAENVMSEALNSFNNRPILAYIHEVDGEWQFYTHNMHIEDGEIVYDEIPVGIVPESCGAKLEYDEEKDKTYVVVNGYIFEEYSKAAEILKREKECSVSVELGIREFSYNAKERCMVFEDIYFTGVTILGKTPDGDEVMPGMQGANIKLADFSRDKNGLFSGDYNSQIIEIRDKLDKLISCFDIENSKKGGVHVSHFEELLIKYDKTAEDINFEYEGLTDAELDTKFAEIFGDINQTDVSGDKATSEEFNKTSEGVNDDTSTTFTRTYELSHDDIRCALYVLLEPVEETDGVGYCIIEVFDNYFIYTDWTGDNTYYGQKYTKNDDVIAFDGERYELLMEYLTPSEKSELDNMRSNYTVIAEKLKTYEDAEMEAKKLEILNSEDYASIKDNEEFCELVTTHESISYEDLQSECDKILLNAIKAGMYSATNQNPTSNAVSKKQFASPSAKKTKPSRYGNLFKKEIDE